MLEAIIVVLEIIGCVLLFPAVVAVLTFVSIIILIIGYLIFGILPFAIYKLLRKLV